tara:strand:- start:641 stop:3682 length:3042 start_codon:yes stop_codon:yes gene_type:complete
MSENDGGNNPEDSDSGDEYSDSDLHAGGVSDTENDQAVIAQAMSAEATLSVDVGSSLTHHDWADIDNSDLVAKVRGSAGFRIMREIQPWDGAASSSAAATLLDNKVFEYFYVQRKDSDMFKKLVKECFPKEYEQASSDKEEKKRLQSMWAQQIMDELKGMREYAKHTIRWLTAINNAQAGDLLFLKREALMNGEHSIQWKAAAIVWESVSNRIKDQTFAAMHAWTNKTGAQSGGVPRMYKHQHELLEVLDKHYTVTEQAVESGGKMPLPLHVILSTPTGSGKTFTAVLTYLRLIKQKHKDVILLYSVPTKQVLKRVGQECEAHAVPYWTAARDNTGDGTMTQVRRPYSIRDKARNKKAVRAARAIGEKVSAGSGTVEQQLEYAADIGFKLKDHGAGKPDIIIADLNTTARILEAAKKQPESSFYNQSKILLYFDEPNMGIHLDPKVLGVVSNIQANMPHAAVLASATLGTWDTLEDWWKGPTEARRDTIEMAPYELPMSKLAVFNQATNEISTISPFGMFKNYGEFQRAMNDIRVPTLLLRHMSAKQGNELLGIDGPEAAWEKVYGDVKSLRLAIEPKMKTIPQPDFEKYKVRWATGEGAPKKVAGIRDALSKEGVTMVGCINPRKTALELAGFENKEDWQAAVHKLNSKLKEAERMLKENAKAEKRAAKKKGDADDENPADAGDDVQVGLVTLRPMLKISLAEALESDIDTLVMLSRGVAYASGKGTETMVKRLYNQALLTVPDSLKGRSPPLNVLVVDYSSIYGTDCPAVDTLLLQEELGRLLAWEDLQQFIGRLRRDGLCIFFSLGTLRKAVLGSHVEAEEIQKTINFQKAVEETTLKLVESKKYDSASVKGALEPLAEQFGRRTGEAGAFAVIALACLSLKPQDMPDSDKELSAQMVKNVEKFSEALEKITGKKQDQISLVSILESLACSQAPFEGRTGGARVLGCAASFLKGMYDADLLSEDGIFAWANQRAKDIKNDPDADQRFFMKVKPFVQWLQEASEDEESDEE